MVPNNVIECGTSTYFKPLPSILSANKTKRDWGKTRLGPNQRPEMRVPSPLSPRSLFQGGIFHIYQKVLKPLLRNPLPPVPSITKPDSRYCSNYLRISLHIYIFSDHAPTQSFHGLLLGYHWRQCFLSDRLDPQQFRRHRPQIG